MLTSALLDDESEERAKAKTLEWKSSLSRFSARDGKSGYGEPGRDGAISPHGRVARC